MRTYYEEPGHVIMEADTVTPSESRGLRTRDANGIKPHQRQEKMK